MHSEATANGHARYADGKTAGSERVPVTLAERGVVIEAGGGEPIVWPYGALEAAVGLSRSSHDALITYKHAPGATLFLDDPALIAALRARAWQLSTGAQRWRWARPVIAGVVVAVLVAVAISLSNLRPAATIAGMIPQQTRELLGRHVVQSMTARHKVCTTADGSAALDRLVVRLRTGAGEAKFNVQVFDWGLVNAFAAPGGQIVITRGLIEKAGGADEVAAVIAHEMGHGIKLHPESGVVRSLGLSTLVELMLGGGGGTLSSIGVLMAELSYSRSAEREADTVAIELLREAKIPVAGLASFFETIEGLKAERTRKAEQSKQAGDKENGKQGGWSGSLDIFSTHPVTAERITNARNVKPYPSTPAMTAADWQALSTICGPSKPAGKAAE